MVKKNVAYLAGPRNAILVFQKAGARSGGHGRTQAAQIGGRRTAPPADQGNQAHITM